MSINANDHENALNKSKAIWLLESTLYTHIPSYKPSRVTLILKLN